MKRIMDGIVLLLFREIPFRACVRYFSPNREVRAQFGVGGFYGYAPDVSK